MRVTDRLRRAGAVAAMAVIIGGGGIAARATAGGAPATSPNPPAAPATGPAGGGVTTSYAVAVRAVLQALAAAHPGQQAEVTIARAGQARTIQVTLGTLPGT